MTRDDHDAPGRRPWYGDDTIRLKAHGAGYAEGADRTLLGCYASIAKHVDSPHITDSMLRVLVRNICTNWRAELKERGLLP